MPDEDIDIVVEMMEYRGYPSNKGGVCRGLGLMAQRAYESGEYDTFAKRMAYLTEFKGTVAELWQRVREAQDRHNPRKNANRAPTKPSPEDAILLSLDAFFFQTSIYIRPRNAQVFFGTHEPHLPQTQFKQAEKLVEEEKPLSDSHHFLLCVNTARKESNARLEAFLETIKNSGAGLLIDSFSHSIHLFYDTTKEAWRLTNHSELKEYASTKELLPELIRRFTNNNIANLSFNVFANEPVLLNKLREISDHSLQSLCEKKEVNNTDTQDASALHVATHWGYIEEVNFLLKHNAAVNIATKNGATPLTVAIFYNNVEAVKALLEKNVRVNGRYLGETPLTYAAAYGYVEIVKMLLEKNAAVSPLVWEEGGSTPLKVAAEYGHLAVIHVLLTKISLENNPEIDVVWKAVKTELPKNELVEKLILYVDTKKTSDNEKYKKAFFIEIALLIASKQFTLETLVGKLEKYSNTNLLFYKGGLFGSKEDSQSAKYVQSLFSMTGHPISETQLKNIVSGQLNTVKALIPKPSQTGLFAGEVKDEVKAVNDPLMREKRRKSLGN